MKIPSNVRTYSELLTIPTFKERYDYLKLNGSVGVESFGFDRYLNQSFYQSREWRHVRDEVIVRDNGCDLGVEGYELHGRILVHHMNPITVNDLLSISDYILNPEFLICVSHNTHNAIHYGDSSLLPKEVVERAPNDTCPWKNQ